ncbi:hypothetical protein QQP08_023913 [Theobroma cacao]|nr:hypothetical protein QQP08_023913 [Theobroma cacao]
MGLCLTFLAQEIWTNPRVKVMMIPNKTKGKKPKPCKKNVEAEEASCEKFLVKRMVGVVVGFVVVSEIVLT